MLASTTVEEIFDRMLARYGSAWRLKWAGVSPDAVKADWRTVLDGFKFDAITYGLSYLPEDFPPTAAQFAKLCRNAPSTEKPQQALLPAPKPDPKRLAAELERLHGLLKDRGLLQWAYDLQERERNGETLTAVQSNAWRRALITPEVGPLGPFTRPLPEELPPAMRPEGTDPADCSKLEAFARERAYRARDPHPRARFFEGRP